MNDHQLLEVYTSHIDVDVDVKKILSLPDNSESSIELSVTLAASVIREPTELIVLDFGLNGISKDTSFSFSGTITGVFKIHRPIPQKEDTQALQSIFSNLAPDIWPYVRELATDIGKRLPSQTVLRLPVSFSIVTSTSK